MSSAPATRAAAVLLALAALVLAPAAATAAAGASLTDIENDVMCVACREPLSVAQSPQAYAERSFIRALIAQGQTKSQIERQLVVQYGPAVLGRPPASGFNLTVYVLPPALVLFGIAVLVIAIPRWRRRSRPLRAAEPPAQPSPADAQRLDQELARYEG
jgi:cytochrome c-type biogenesis protein CcmH/NrfF